MSKNWLALSVSIALLSFLAFYIWASHRRFYIVSSGSVAYEVDRKTGRTWLLRGASKTLHEEPIPPPNPDDSNTSELPPIELFGVTGRASMDSLGKFSGKIYNGSSWDISNLTLSIGTKEGDGQAITYRQYSVPLTSAPLSATYFSVMALGESSQFVNWHIVTASGHKNLAVKIKRRPGMFIDLVDPNWRSHPDQYDLVGIDEPNTEWKPKSAVLLDKETTNTDNRVPSPPEGFVLDKEPNLN